MDNFESFVEKHRQEILKVEQLLAIPLKDNPIDLSDQLRTVEPWHSRIGMLLAHAESFLDLAARDLLPVKEEGFTELDRQIKLKAALASQRRFRDVLEAVYRAIGMRVSLGQSLLSAQKREALLSER